MNFLRNVPVDLRHYLPLFMQVDESYTKLLDAESAEHEKQRLALQDISDQFYIQTATWGLSDWERLLELTPNPGDDYTQRRNRILLRLQSHQTSTVEFLEKLVKRYLTEDGEARIREDNPRNVFHIILDSGRIKYRKDLIEGLETYKPAHLGYDFLIQVARFVKYNCSGPIVKTIIKGRTWTEGIPYVVFFTGYNAAGATESITISAKTGKVTSYQFPRGTRNGRIRFNGREGRDLLQTQKQTTEVILEPLRCASRFVRPAFARNQFGELSKDWVDVGTDKEVTETHFTASTRNDVATEQTEETRTRTTIESRIVFTGPRRNGHGRILRNDAPRQTIKTEHVTQETIQQVRFTGTLRNGSLRYNAMASKTETRTVHFPVWREVISRKGSSLYNACPHETRVQVIEHTEPDRIWKTFNPSIGTLYNNHAVRGYLRI